MSTVRVRLMGGPLHGQVLWVDEAKASLNVQVAGKGDAISRTWQYRRDGGLLQFVGEVLP